MRYSGVSSTDVYGVRLDHIMWRIGKTYEITMNVEGTSNLI